MYIVCCVCGRCEEPHRGDQHSHPPAEHDRHPDTRGEPGRQREYGALHGVHVATQATGDPLYHR